LTLPQFCGKLDQTQGKEEFKMAVFSVKTEKMSEEETKAARIRHEDFVWWCDNSSKFFVKENRGKYFAVVNKEAFSGDTFQSAEANAMAKYPNRQCLVVRIPNREGKRI
jgi:hypothetical protein